MFSCFSKSKSPSKPPSKPKEKPQTNQRNTNTKLFYSETTNSHKFTPITPALLQSNCQPVLFDSTDKPNSQKNYKFAAIQSHQSKQNDTIVDKSSSFPNIMLVQPSEPKQGQLFQTQQPCISITPSRQLILNTHSYADFMQSQLSQLPKTCRHKRPKNKRNNLNYTTTSGFVDIQQENRALQTNIVLQNFRIQLSKIERKLTQNEQNECFEQTLAEAENSFYCQEGSIVEQFARSVVALSTSDLSRTLYAKMSCQQKNTKDSKGYVPVHILILKSMVNSGFMELTRQALYDPEVSLQCRGPSGWSPLQEAIFYRNIPLAAHVFKATYNKKQLYFKQALKSIAALLQAVPDFEMEVEIKVDSFLPLVGILTPSDTLKIKKIHKKIWLSYSLVGYQFPTCKRRDMGVFFDGINLWGLNRSKMTYCDLLESLQQDEMVALVEDLLLLDQLKTGSPIIHQISLEKAQSLFNNDIKEEISDRQATKYILMLNYTSTIQKRKIGPQARLQQLGFMNNYALYCQRNEQIAIKQKNRNKKVELQMWLCPDFPLQVSQLLSVLEPLGMGNTLVAEWVGFLRNSLANRLQNQRLFPVKVDIPLSYSLYFNIEFLKFRPIEGKQYLILPQELKQIPRSQFQNTLESRQKRSVLLKAFT